VSGAGGGGVFRIDSVKIDGIPFDERAEMLISVRTVFTVEQVELLELLELELLELELLELEPFDRESDSGFALTVLIAS